MSFGEKIHWVSLLAILGGFGWYFFTLHNVGYGHGSGDTGQGYYSGLLVWVAGGIIFIMTLASIFMAFREPKEIQSKFDERDHIIHMRGTHMAYYVFVVGLWLVIMSAFYGRDTFFLINAMLAVSVIAESIRIGTQIYLYRRGAI